MNQNPGAWTPPGIESAAQPGRQASQEHLMALFVGRRKSCCPASISGHFSLA